MLTAASAVRVALAAEVESVPLAERVELERRVELPLAKGAAVATGSLTLAVRVLTMVLTSVSVERRQREDQLEGSSARTSAMEEAHG